jgi:hypothetical protein
MTAFQILVVLFASAFWLQGGLSFATSSYGTCSLLQRVNTQQSNQHHGVGTGRLQRQSIHPWSRHTILNNKAAAETSKSTDTKNSVTRFSALFKSLPFKVGSFYIIVSVYLTCYSPLLSPVESTVALTLLWMGFVMAISFMEAWVKFRAPFLPRHYGLDVGRTVFPVLNAVEVALCAGLWLAQQQRQPTRLSWMLLRGATLILFSQVVYLTPQLVLLGKHVLVDAFPMPQPQWSDHQRQVYHDLQKQVQQTPRRPSSKLHVVYVLQDLIKLIWLAALACNCRG